MFASTTVNQLFNRVPAEAFWGGLKVDRHEGDRLVMRVRIGGIFDDLQAAIREEMGTDERLPSARSSVLQQPHPAQREMTRLQADEGENQKPSAGDSRS